MVDYEQTTKIFKSILDHFGNLEHLLRDFT